MYVYELWNGREVVGEFVSFSRLQGKFLYVPEEPMLKQIYGGTFKTIKVPITQRVVKDTGVEFTIRMVLDVRKKSKRQIEILKGYNEGNW